MQAELHISYKVMAHETKYYSPKNNISCSLRTYYSFLSFYNITKTERLPSVETHATDVEGYFSPSSTRPLWGSTNHFFFLLAKEFIPQKLNPFIPAGGAQLFFSGYVCSPSWQKM